MMLLVRIKLLVVLKESIRATEQGGGFYSGCRILEDLGVRDVL
jgi:hypothetical protein